MKQKRFKNVIERKFGIEIILFEGDNIFSLDFYLPKDEGEKIRTKRREKKFLQPTRKGHETSSTIKLL